MKKYTQQDLKIQSSISSPPSGEFISLGAKSDGLYARIYGQTEDKIVLTSELSNYLPKSGGNLTGNIWWNNDSEIIWDRNTDYAKLYFRNTGDGDTNSYMGFEVGDNGDEFFRFASTTNEWLTIKSDAVRFFGNTIWHSGNFTNLNQLSTRNFSDIQNKPTTLAGYGITDGALASHTHSYLPLYGGTLTGNLSVAQALFSSIITTGNQQLISSSSTIVYVGNPSTNLKLESSSNPTILVGGVDNILWHTGNFSPSNYLPLSGGNMSGNINLTGYGIWNVSYLNNNDVATNHQIQLGYSGHNSVDIYEFGGALNLIQSISGVNTNILNVNPTNFLYKGNEVWTTGNFNPSNYMRASVLNGMVGMVGADGSNDVWIRTTTAGIIPYAAGNWSSLGTDTWQFNSVFAVNLFENKVKLSDKYLGINAKAVDSELLDGLNSSDFTRSISYDYGTTQTISLNYLTGNTQYWAKDQAYQTVTFTDTPETVGLGGFGLINTNIGSAYNFQIFNAYGSQDIWWRQSVYDSGLHYQDWYRFWHSGNFNPSDYLALSGGTVTGALTINGSVNSLSVNAAADYWIANFQSNGTVVAAFRGGQSGSDLAFSYGYGISLHSDNFAVRTFSVDGSTGYITTKGGITLETDNTGITFADGAKVYKRSGAGLVLKRHNDGVDPMVSNAAETSFWTIWHAGNSNNTSTNWSANKLLVPAGPSTRGLSVDDFNYYSPKSHDNHTWLRNSTGIWTFQSGAEGDDWYRSFQIYQVPVADAERTLNDRFVEFGQRMNNNADGSYKGIRIVKSVSGSVVDGDLQAGYLYSTNTGRSARFGGNTDAVISLPQPTSYIEVQAGSGSGTNSSGISFHNPGISSALLSYVNSDANTGKFLLQSDDGNKSFEVRMDTKLYKPFLSDGIFPASMLTFSTDNGTYAWNLGEIVGYVKAGEWNSEAQYPGGLLFRTKEKGDYTAGMSDRGVVDSQGNWGFGTITPIPTARVTITKDISWNNDVINGQLILTGQSTTNKRLVLGYDTTSNYGFIAAGNQGVEWSPILLNPNGGGVGIGGGVQTGFTLDVHGATVLRGSTYQIGLTYQDGTICIVDSTGEKQIKSQSLNAGLYFNTTNLGMYDWANSRGIFNYAPSQNIFVISRDTHILGSTRHYGNVEIDSTSAIYFGKEESFGGSDIGGNDYGCISYRNNDTTYGNGAGESSCLVIEAQNDGGEGGDHIAIQPTGNLYLNPSGTLYRGSRTSRVRIYDEGNIADFHNSKLWSTTHTGDFYLYNEWDGNYWQLKSNHGSGVNVGRAYEAGNADTLDGLHSTDFARSGYGLGVDGNTVLITNCDSATKQGLYYTNGASNSPVSGDGTLIVTTYDTNWVIQIFNEFNGKQQGRMYKRQMYGGVWQSWYQIWDSVNDGSGSGLDADTVDGLHASSFALTSHGHSVISSKGITTAETGRNVIDTGIYTFNVNNNNLGTPTGGGGQTPTSYYSVLAWGNGVGGSAELAASWVFGGTELWFRSLRDTTDNWWDWKKIWHSGNMGTGSGLDADTTDGKHIWSGTQASYDAITSKDSNTIYIII